MARQEKKNLRFKSTPKGENWACDGQVRVEIHVTRLVMCRQPQQKSGCKQPRATQHQHHTEALRPPLSEDPTQVVENELHELNWIFNNTGFRFEHKLEMTKKILYKCSILLAFIMFKYFTRRHILSVKSISSSLTGIKACTLLKCTTRATICRRARCRGIGLFARRAAGSGPLKGWVPSLNKAWEMPARPRVTNGWRETWTCYHEGNQIK